MWESAKVVALGFGLSLDIAPWTNLSPEDHEPKYVPVTGRHISRKYLKQKSRQAAPANPAPSPDLDAAIVRL